LNSVHFLLVLQKALLYRGFPNPPGVRATRQAADLEVGDTAGLEACATGPRSIGRLKLMKYPG
jgi:hypothetical protein